MYYDVIIIGGGVMGCAVAYFLASEPTFGGKTLVIERDPSYANCATTRSWGGIRQQFSTAENIQMSLFGARFAKSAGSVLAVDGDRPELDFREQGYLFLASAAGYAALRDNGRLQREHGAATEWLDGAALQARFPWLHTTDLAGAGFGPRDEGWIDPHALLHGLRRKARSLGVEFITGTVNAIRRNGSGQRVGGVTLADGHTLDCGALVNAAGPQAGALAALAGIALPVAPRKRMSYVFTCREPFDMAAVPLTIDPTGVAFRPEGGQFIATVSPPADADPDVPDSDLELEYQLFDTVIWPALAARVPAFEAIKLISAWAGHYDYNRFDQNAIIGPHPEIGNFYFCNGFSGHGIQQAPAAGRAIAELICHGAFRSLDLSRLGYARLMEERPLREANVV